jgi:hypothetical protein
MKPNGSDGLATSSTLVPRSAKSQSITFGRTTNKWVGPCCIGVAGSRRQAIRDETRIFGREQIKDKQEAVEFVTKSATRALAIPA